MPNTEWSKFDIDNENLYLALLVFENGKLPDIFLLPSEIWRIPNEVFELVNGSSYGCGRCDHGTWLASSV